MFTIKFEGQRKKQTPLTFYSSFDELTVGAFVGYMVSGAKVEEHLAEADNLKQQIVNVAGSGNTALLDMLDLDNRLLEADSLVRLHKVKQIAYLSKHSKVTFDYLYNTKGVTYELLAKTFIAVEDKLGDFNTWYDSVKAVDSVRLRRKGFRKREFKIFNMDSSTVLRDTVAAKITSQLHKAKDSFLVNDWSVFPKFLSYVLRPAKEKIEITPIKQNRKKAFLYNKQLENLPDADRLTLYNEKLDKDAAARAKMFNRIGLATGLGVYKQYFFLNRP